MATTRLPNPSFLLLADPGPGRAGAPGWVGAAPVGLRARRHLFRLLFLRACAPVFVSRDYPGSDLQDGVKLARALFSFWLGPSKDAGEKFQAGTEERPGSAGFWAKGFKGH